MPSLPLISIHEAGLAFGKKVLFENLSLHICDGDRICLVGANGTGKSTLMKIITGDMELDEGKRWLAPRVVIGHLPQEGVTDSEQTIREYVFEGLRDTTEQRKLLAIENPQSNSDKLENHDSAYDEQSYLADMVLEPLELDGSRQIGQLSGGQKRRATLARALVSSPDILLLDEPTNHLDLEAIEWLEDFLSSWQGALLCISHDREFLRQVSTKTFWLDRGSMRTNNQGYAKFDEWSIAILEHEQRELAKLGKKIDYESNHAQRSITGRRKRNERRLKELYQMRDKMKADKARLRQRLNRINLEPLSPEKQGKMAVEFHKVFYDINKPNGEKQKILDDFSLRIVKKDRIGVIGPNGSGKSSFLKLLVGEIEPERGTIKRRELQNNDSNPNHGQYGISYFDQNRNQLMLDDTARENLVPKGGSHLRVAGRDRHVIAYLKDFMFEPAIADVPVKTLSGGQRARLMLAKILAEPADFLILDEPTNDLDMDTLDMLQDILSKYQGTLLLVSHDRDFLDRSVSKILAFEGDGQVSIHHGGYSDYLTLKQIEKQEQQQGKDSKGAIANHSNNNTQQDNHNKIKIAKPKKLSYKVQREFEQLPGKITALEQEINELEQQLADSELYIKDPAQFDNIAARLEEAKSELEYSETRWLELSMDDS